MIEPDKNSGEDLLLNRGYHFCNGNQRIKNLVQKLQCEVNSVVLLLENASKLKIDIHSPLEELNEVEESSNG